MCFVYLHLYLNICNLTCWLHPSKEEFDPWICGKNYLWELAFTAFVHSIDNTWCTKLKLKKIGILWLLLAKEQGCQIVIVKCCQIQLMLHLLPREIQLLWWENKYVLVHTSWLLPPPGKGASAGSSVKLVMKKCNLVSSYLSLFGLQLFFELFITQMYLFFGF